MIVTQDFVQTCYNDYINQIGKDRKEHFYVGHEDKYSASGAGQCVKKHWYKTHGYPESPPGIRSNRLLRLGTIVHEDIQNAIIKYKNELIRGKEEGMIPIINDIHIEMCVEIPSLNVRGHCDDLRVNIASAKAVIYDFKTAHSFKWQKMFGHTKNRDKNPNHNYELQIGTYAQGLSLKLGISPYDIEMILLYYKKDDSSIREVRVDQYWMEAATDYWGQVMLALEDVNEPDDLPRGNEGIPYEGWECSYCPFEKICK